MQYALPSSLPEALALRARGPWQVLAGGTDFYPALVEAPLGSDVLDISGIDALRGIECTAADWRIGALATWTDVLAADLPPAFEALRLAARELGSIQIQNAATVAGNLCNASPAADGVPPLLVMNARVELAAASATREVPLDAFILGNRATALRGDELVTAILIPREQEDARTHFVKLGARKYLVISIAMVAALIEIGPDASITTARVAVGSCSAVARRLVNLEQRLLGARADSDFCDIVRPDALTELAPIDDVRATADYRMHAAVELVQRTLRTCARSLA